MIVMAAHGRKHAVGIAQDEETLVLGIRLQIDDAAGEHVRADHVEADVLQGPLPLQAEEVHPLLPLRSALLSVEDLDAGGPVVVAVDAPLESEVVQRGGLDEEIDRPHAVARRGRIGESGEGAQCDSKDCTEAIHADSSNESWLG